MAYSKPYLTVKDQLALIKSRGMIISDEALAESYLNKIGYYRLSGYWYPYREAKQVAGITKVLDDFKSGTKFSEIVDLYVFDKKLRLVFLDVIERIEIALRVQITLQLGKQGADAHRNPKALHPNFLRQINQKTGKSQHAEWLARNDDAFDRSKEEFAKHFRTKYFGEIPPIWIAAELWDFGTMSFLYAGMRKSDQIAVAKTFNVPSFDVMETWLRSINVARNICAHHSRFWNKPSVVQPKWPSAVDVPDLGHIVGDTNAQTRIYGLACLCAHLLKSINPNSTWLPRFKSTVSDFPSSTVVNLKSAGFPADWDKTNLWS
ncbi:MULTISPECIES: Abi family protein [unclassified Tardiphaga]|jgi:abortive infection bacteriophage resistance protein|uniref:Abi family protein n=1 Tax=unclassified Tardiphaga TaxID=2631404 RepID=UPI003F2729AC